MPTPCQPPRASNSATSRSHAAVAAASRTAPEVIARASSGSGEPDGCSALNTRTHVRRLGPHHRQKRLVRRSLRFRGSVDEGRPGAGTSGEAGSGAARFRGIASGTKRATACRGVPAGDGEDARDLWRALRWKRSCINWATGALGLLTCSGATHHPDRRTELADGLASRWTVVRSRGGDMSAPRPRGSSGVSYAHAEEGYFDKRGLTRAAGFWGLWGLGVAAVISGDFSGWNFGIGGAGWGGFLIATADRHADVRRDDRQHRRDVGGHAAHRRRLLVRPLGDGARGAASSPVWPRRSSTSRRRRSSSTSPRPTPTASPTSCSASRCPPGSGG